MPLFSACAGNDKGHVRQKGSNKSVFLETEILSFLHVHLFLRHLKVTAKCSEKSSEM